MYIKIERVAYFVEQWLNKRWVDGNHHQLNRNHKSLKCASVKHIMGTYHLETYPNVKVKLLASVIYQP